MEDLLNLQGYNIIAQKQKDNGDYLFQVEVTPPMKCQYEGCNGTILVRYGVKPQLYKDLPIQGNHVGIEVFRKRYKCKGCKKTFFENLRGMDDKRFMTRRLIEYIEQQSLKRTFVSIAGEVGILETTVRDMFKDYVEKLERTFAFKVPEWIGISIIKIMKSQRCVITNVKDGMLIGILKDGEENTVLRYLDNIGSKKDIKGIYIDIRIPYREKVKMALPDAQIIVDKYHVLSMANQAIVTIRKAYRKLACGKDIFFEKNIRKYPDLCEAHNLRNELCVLWNSAVTKQAAMKLYEEWVNKIPTSIKYAFEPLLAAVNNWYDETFEYFEHQKTNSNSYSEDLSILEKVINRLGRGDSFEALRASVLYFNDSKEEKSLGVSIRTLKHKMLQ